MLKRLLRVVFVTAMIMDIQLLTIQNLKPGDVFKVFGNRTSKPVRTEWNIINDSLEMSRQAIKRNTTTSDLHLRILLCNNIKQLFQAYYEDFDIEYLDTTWKTLRLQKRLIAKLFGLHSKHLFKDDRYLSVKVKKIRESLELNVSFDSIILNETITSLADNITANDTASVQQFIQNVGTHYVSSFSTGDFLYQVLVYTNEMQESVSNYLKTEIKYFNPEMLFLLFSIKSPILSASHNECLEKWARDHLHYQNFPNVLKYLNDNELARQVDSMLTNEALVQLELHTLAPLFKDAERRSV